MTQTKSCDTITSNVLHKTNPTQVDKNIAILKIEKPDKLSDVWLYKIQNNLNIG